MIDSNGVQAHLTEEERQEMADGSLPTERAPGLGAHLRNCALCSPDVARLERLVRRAREAAAEPSTGVDELWPGIRARIEGGKLVQLPGDSSGGPPRAHAWWRASGGSALASRYALVVAAVAVAALLLLTVTRARDVSRSAPARGGEAAPPIVAADDSARLYQEEAQALLDQLELRRAMLPPEAAAAMDHDLAVVDSAIVEVRAAIARDPNNPALRQLLALSYRKKVEVLQRVSNAG